MNAEELNRLLERAQAARAHAYAPYSRFAVGAALLTETGEVFSGANVENASYGLTICAERSAAVSAASAGHRRFRAIAVAGPDAGTTPPCGACRQFLNEFSPQMIVVYSTPRGAVSASLESLLPHAFTP